MSAVLRLPEWMADARCDEVDPEIFFPDQGGTSLPARRVCRKCTVQLPCLLYALHNEFDDEGRNHGGQYGIYGGLTPTERRQLYREHRTRGVA